MLCRDLDAVRDARAPSVACTAGILPLSFSRHPTLFYESPDLVLRSPQESTDISGYCSTPDVKAWPSVIGYVLARTKRESCIRGDSPKSRAQWCSHQARRSCFYTHGP
jgi:hypothetical protein